MSKNLGRTASEIEVGGVYGDFAEIFPEKISTLQISRPESERFK